MSEEEEMTVAANLVEKFVTYNGYDEPMTISRGDYDELVKAVAAALKEAFEQGVKQVNHAISLIERAEQRERCASIAWECGREESDPLYKDYACKLADEIAARISNASLAPGDQPEQRQNTHSTPRHTRR